MKELITIREAEQITGISKWSFYKYIAGGEIRHIRFKRQIYLRKADIDAFLDKHTVENWSEGVDSKWDDDIGEIAGDGE